MARCVCCPPYSYCAAGCYVPTTLNLTLSVGSFLGLPGDFTPTAAEEALLSSIVDGTYIVEWDGLNYYELDITAAGWQRFFSIAWSCTDSSIYLNPTVAIFATFCNLSSPYLTFNAYTSAGVALARADYPGSPPASILDYCGGQTEIVNDAAIMEYRKIQCDRTALAPRARFDMSVLLEA